MVNLRFEHGENVLVAYLAGEIDHHSAAMLRFELDEAISRSEPEELVMDFGGVGFMDSSGVGLILGRHKLMQASGGELVVQGAPTQVRKILNLANIKCE